MFIVGYLGEGRAAKVLFEQESGSENYRKIKEEKQTDTRTSENSIAEYNSRLSLCLGTKQREDYTSETFIAFRMTDILNDFHVSQTDKYGALPAHITSDTSNVQAGITNGFMVRTLTPLECERLQGFPDGWTDNQSDAQRYKQLGNAVCIPVIKWLGERILENEVLDIR